MNWLRAVIAGICLWSAGCWLFNGPGPVTPTVPDGGFADASAGQTFVDCSDKALHDAWVKLLPTIETGLASGSLQATLITAGVYLGAPLVVAEVACGVAWVVAKAEAQNAALAERGVMADAVEDVKAKNGRAWLATCGVTPVRFQ